MADISHADEHRIRDAVEDLRHHLVGSLSDLLPEIPVSRAAQIIAGQVVLLRQQLAEEPAAAGGRQ